MIKAFLLTVILFRLDGAGLPTITQTRYNTVEGCEQYKSALQGHVAARWEKDGVSGVWRFAAFCHEDRAVAWPSQ